MEDRTCYVQHMLFECENTKELALNEWAKVENSFPIAMLESVNRMTLREKTIFMISGLNGRYVEEFADVYNAILEFVNVMIKEFERKIQNECQ